MPEKKLVFFVLIFNSIIGYSQTTSKDSTSSFVFFPELNFGHSFTDYNEFPSRNPQYNVLLNFGWRNLNKNWTDKLRRTTTGISVGYSNFGNNELLGSAYSLMPFIKFDISKNKRFSALFSIGTSFFTKEFNEETNFGNKAISTDFVWSFRSFFYYKLSEKENPFSIGLGFFHHSNGHTRLPNQGINSALVSVSKPLFSSSNDDSISLNSYDSEEFRTRTYLSIQTSYGDNSLSIPFPFNENGLVSRTSIDYGKILNPNLKLGIGAYYTFYEHYYKYISNNESMVQEGREFESLKDNPTWNASAIGVSVNGELLLNHIGIEARIGFNIHKPAYKIDTRINQGWYFFPREFPIDSGYPLGELDTEYKLKRFISTRLGLNYYLISTREMPKHNVFFGAHINANLGQADFTEFTIGYVYTFKKSG
jgi:hypothetical protein